MVSTLFAALSGRRSVQLLTVVQVIGQATPLIVIVFTLN